MWQCDTMLRVATGLCLLAALLLDWGALSGRQASFGEPAWKAGANGRADVPLAQPRTQLRWIATEALPQVSKREGSSERETTSSLAPAVSTEHHRARIEHRLQRVQGNVAAAAAVRGFAARAPPVRA
jgi:hypothetical protein